MDTNNCFHCGLDIVKKDEIRFDEKVFCCNGCKTVYEIFSSSGLTSYYDLERSPGATPQTQEGKYDFLENDRVVEKLLEFHEGDDSVVSLNIPHIHCSSCIWILENLNKLDESVLHSQVTFHDKKVRIHFDSGKRSLKNLVDLLCRIGYEPYISLENYDAGKQKADRSLIYKLGVAFFCFGNVMLLSFPEYFEINEFWLDQYKGFFRWMIFALSLPSFLYSASGYYLAAWKGLRANLLNIEIPIALGIIVMFVRSLFDIVMDYGPGFFDSMTGLVFFMLLGKMFQAKTYNFLSFERDYKSYFPIGVTCLRPDGTEESIPVYEVGEGQRLLIRNQELIPVDGILYSESAQIDYSFVTGESLPVEKKSGDKIFAGGRLSGTAIEMSVLHSVSQSYLTQLWSHDVFQKETKRDFKTLTDTISRYFTPILLLISIVGFSYWIFIDANTAFNVFTAVLIVACPCALALTAPFTMGNVLRIFGRSHFYLKNAKVIEQLSHVDTIVFDKTGTITTGHESHITYEGNPFSDDEILLLKSALRGSNHPLSRMLYHHLKDVATLKPDAFEEISGKGIEVHFGDRTLRIGSAAFVGTIPESDFLKTSVHVSIDGKYSGRYVFRNEYRKEVKELFSALRGKYDLKILSGDNEGEKPILRELLPGGTEMIFNQKPEQKLQFIEKLQKEGKNVMMVGDGLNDAGALAQSDVGVSISENVNAFTPACDAILDAKEFGKLAAFLKMSHKAEVTVKWSFALSLLYNVVGLSFAVTGNLLPLVAAIIMPLSTVTIISFVTITSNLFARKLKIFHRKPNHD